MIANYLFRCAILPASLALVSCFETTQEFTLNPDGSGKVVHESKFQPFQMNLSLGAENADEDAKMREAVASIIEDAQGVDAWNDVHFERLADGRILFRGTAWFPDITKLEIKNQTMMRFQWTRDPSANGELTLSMGNQNDDAADPEKNSPPDDEEGRRTWLAAERGKFQQARMMMATMLGGLKHTATFRLAGAAAGAHQFDDIGDDRLQIEFAGEKFLAAIDSAMADDEWLLANGFAGEEGPDLDGVLAEKLFGKPGMPSVTRSTLDEPLFNYQAEVAAARANAEVLREKIGVASARVLPPSQGGPLKSARLVGIRVGAKIDDALDLRPFNHDPGLTFSILCEFDGAILNIDDKSTLETAVTDDGTSLLPRSNFQRRLRWPKLSPCNTHALFDVNLDLPPSGTTKLRDLAGTLHYSVSADTKEIDLGISKIEKGQRGEELGAEITEIEPGWQNEGPLNLSLRLNIRNSDLKTVWLVKGESRQPLEQRGHGSSNNITTFTLELPKSHDADSRIVVEIHDEIQTYTTPLILRDIVLPVIESP